MFLSHLILLITVYLYISKFNTYYYRINYFLMFIVFVKNKKINDIYL